MCTFNISCFKIGLLQKMTLESPPRTAHLPRKSGRHQPLLTAKEPQSLSQTTQPPPTAPSSAMSVLLIGSTGMGKSTLGNFLLDPDEDHIVERPTFPPGEDNKPATQKVKVVCRKVQIGDGRSEVLTLIDTPGLNESPEKDLVHMIDIINELHMCQKIRAIIFVVKFNARIDAQYKATIEYYSKLLPGLFESNVLIVMTDFATDEHSEIQRERRRINVEKVKQNTMFEIGQCSGNQIKYTPQLFTIDSLPAYDDERDISQRNRTAILDYILQLPQIEVKNQMVAKTDYIKQKDAEKYEQLQGEIKGYNERLKEDHKESAIALDDTCKKKKQIDNLNNEISNLQEVLLDRNTTELVVAGHKSINEEWRVLRWFTQKVSIKSPQKITHYTTWTNGKSEFKDIVATSHEVRGRVEGNFMRGIYASLTVYTEKRIKYAHKIQELADKIREKNMDLKKCKEEWKEFQKLHKDKEEEIELLQKYIEDRRDVAIKLHSNLMTMEDAIKRLEELIARDS